MEWQALLLGLEPVTAALVGVGVPVAAPVVAVIDSATGSKLSESTRSLAKQGMMLAFESFDQVQCAVAEAQETVQDLIAEARTELTQAKQNAAESKDNPVTPQEIELN